jgi:hypothetical protein
MEHLNNSIKEVTDMKPARGLCGPLSSKCAVIVASCDRYSDTWDTYNVLFERFWPECPFPVYLLSNKRGCSFPRIQSLRVGPDLSWSSNLLAGLAQIRQEYVILMVDDLFLTRPADSKRINEILRWTIAASANCVHLYGRPRPGTQDTELVGALPPGTYYRTSAISSLWRKSVLAGVLKEGETAWDFEIEGSRRSNAYDGFYSSLEPCFDFANGIIKGKWDPRALAVLQRLGIEPSTQQRGLLRWRQRVSLRMIEIRSAILRLFPLAMRGRLKNAMVGASFKYRSYSS